MPTAIAYPDTTGFRASSDSAILKVAGIEITGFVEVKGSRKRERVIVQGPNADPLGKTRGKNTYSLTLSLYAAEMYLLVYALQNGYNGSGTSYGDTMFRVEVTITEQGYDTQTWDFRGCTLDGQELTVTASSADPLKVETIEFTPLKLYINGIDDNAKPLTGVPSVG